MKLSAKFAFWSCVVIWIFALLPFFVPALNTLKPLVLGLPFVVFWEYLAIVLHVLLCLFCAKYVWDSFDADETKEVNDQ